MDVREVSSLGSSKEVNRTYIISSLTSRRDEASTSGRLTLQRRTTNNKNTGAGEQEASENTENQQSQGKRLTLQRRTRAGSTDKGSHPHTSTVTEKRAWTSSKVLSEPNSRTGSVPLPLRSASLRERGLLNSTKDVNTPVKTTEKVKNTDREQKTFLTPTGKTQFERISVKKEVFEKLSAKDPPKLLKLTGVERLKQVSAGSNGGAIPGLAHKKVPVIGQNRSAISSTRKTTTQLSTGFNAKSKPPPCETRVSIESTSQHAALSPKELKMENSAVTVAVRVRPFSHR